MEDISLSKHREAKAQKNKHSADRHVNNLIVKTTDRQVRYI